MLRAIVFKTTHEHSIVLNENNEFVRIKTKKGLSKGQEIFYFNEDVLVEERSNRTLSKTIISIATVAALLLMMFAIPNMVTPTVVPEVAAVITLDINPSIEIAIDESEIVLDVRALNGDGKELISEDMIGMTFEEVIEIVLLRMEDYNYLEDNKTIVVSSVEFSEEIPTFEVRLAEIIENESETLDDITVYLFKGNQDEYRNANSQGVSLGRLKLALGLDNAAALTGNIDDVIEEDDDEDDIYEAAVVTDEEDTDLIDEINALLLALEEVDEEDVDSYIEDLLLLEEYEQKELVGIKKDLRRLFNDYKHEYALNKDEDDEDEEEDSTEIIEEIEALRATLAIVEDEEVQTFLAGIGEYDSYTHLELVELKKSLRGYVNDFKKEYDLNKDDDDEDEEPMSEEERLELLDTIATFTARLSLAPEDLTVVWEALDVDLDAMSDDELVEYKNNLIKLWNEYKKEYNLFIKEDDEDEEPMSEEEKAELIASIEELVEKLNLAPEEVKATWEVLVGIEDKLNDPETDLEALKKELQQLWNDNKKQYDLFIRGEDEDDEDELEEESEENEEESEGQGKGKGKGKGQN